MDSRQKFNSVFDGDDTISVPKVEFAYWVGTLRRWAGEGLKLKEDIPDCLLDSDSLRGAKPLSKDYALKTDRSVMEYFRLDSYLEKFPFDISPMLKKETVLEDGQKIIYKDEFGITNKMLKQNPGIPMVLDYPIKDRKSFYSYISTYDRDFKKRLPVDFDEMAKILKERDFPIRLGGNPFGFSFLARHLMGEVMFMMSMYDDPGLIKEFNRFYLDFVMEYWQEILTRLEVDCIFILEDIAYRSGSFISKEMFYEFLRPFYIEFIDYIRQFGIKNIFVDCDGLIDELIPLWVDVGVTGIFPIEAVNDIEKIRQGFKDLNLLGGFNKKVLFNGSTKEEIDQELKKTENVLKKGRYIPHIDHAVSEDVTWENFKYYRERLNMICESS